jgi:hypothetical protein
MRKLNIVDWAGALALASVSGLFVVWALKIIIRTAGKDWSWEAAESIGTWVAGLGTLAAVVVSLVLARSSDRKEQSKDYLRARMTALRYIGKLVKIKSDLIFFKTWLTTKGTGPWISIDDAGDTSVTRRLAALKLDASFDDLVLLAPIEQKFRRAPASTHTATREMQRRRGIPIRCSCSCSKPHGGARTLGKPRIRGDYNRIAHRRRRDSAQPSIGNLREIRLHAKPTTGDP